MFINFLIYRFWITGFFSDLHSGLPTFRTLLKILT